MADDRRLDESQPAAGECDPHVRAQSVLAEPTPEDEDNDTVRMLLQMCIDEALMRG